jgi:hypothetical protein
LTGGRFAPELSLTIAGTEVKDDIASLSCDFSVTDQVQGLEVELGNLADKYAALTPFDEIVLALNGTQRLYARADSCNPDYSKAGAKVFRVKGRQIAGSALQDIVASLQFVDEHPDDIVEGIIASYNASKGASDPTITIGNNLAPTDITMSPRWQRKSYWKMLQELQEALGGPVADGGADEFFDFWIGPATTGDFYFENAGHEDSAIVVPDNSETTKGKRILDATAVKNDVWVWGNSQAGRIPLEMQLTDLTGLADTWTEGNAADYTASSSPTAGATVENQTDSGLGLPYVKVGHQSIHLKGYRNFILEERATLHLAFPKAGIGVIWPAQYPGGHFNAYNEVAMSESMGEFVGCHFWFKSNTNCVVLIQVTDGAGVVAYSSSGYGYQVGWWPPKDAGDWQELVFSFGPSANYSVVENTKPLPIFNWSDVAEIAWVCKANWGQGYPNPNADYWFDGLYFVKPLVVNAYSTSDGVRKSVHVAKDEIVNYASAKLIANALLEQQMKPQIYWDFEEIGRDDIPSGYRFTLGSTELLMREQRWQFSKEAGWILTGKAWEKT